MNHMQPGPIQRGVPIPPRGRYQYPVRVRWNFAGLKNKGDSFATVPEGISIHNLRVRISVAAHRYGKDMGRKFTVRAVVEDGVEVVRCWRVR